MEQRTDHERRRAPDRAALPRAEIEPDREPAALAALFDLYRREGWSDAEIEMGLAGQ